MENTADILVVSKHDNSKHKVIGVPIDLPELPPSSVRVRTRLISVSSNNLSYARNGHALYWWDTYPVPLHSSCDARDWGIVPAWGYGEIIDSTIDGLRGGLLFGFWPMSSYPVDLMLEETEPKGHWVETSSARSRLMNLYNRYVVVEGNVMGSDEMQGWTAALSPLFGAGYQINRYVFPEKGPCVHPYGKGAWICEDADLTSALVVSLSAGTKTARGMASQFRCRVENGPLGLLQVSRNPDLAIDGSSIAGRACGYDEIGNKEVQEWMAALNAARVVIIDFGAPGGTVEVLMKSIGLLGKKPMVTLIGVGTEMRVLSADEMKERLVTGQKLGRVQFNSSGLRDRGIEIDGPEAYFRLLNEAFKKWIEMPAGLGNLQLAWGSGVDGPNGLAGIWERLCAGALEPEKTCVFKL